MLNNSGMDNDTGHKQWQTKRLELITQMAKTLGYGKSITALDVDRVYYPTGLGKTFERNEQLANELLRVLKSSKGVALTPLVETQHPNN